MLELCGECEKFVLVCVLGWVVGKIKFLCEGGCDLCFVWSDGGVDV